MIRIHQISEDCALACRRNHPSAFISRASVRNVVIVRVLFDGTDSVSALSSSSFLEA